MLRTAPEIRRSHLMRILAQEYDHDCKAFGEAIGKTRGLVDNWINDRRTVGNTDAREVEENLGLPHGYLDQPMPFEDTLQITRGTPPARVASTVADAITLIERRCRVCQHDDVADLLAETIQRLREIQSTEDDRTARQRLTSNP